MDEDKAKSPDILEELEDSLSNPFHKLLVSAYRERLDQQALIERAVQRIEALCDEIA